MYNINDYVEGYEYYGDEIRKMKGWVDKVSKDEEGKLILHIQCDDEFDGYRGNSLYEKLGEIKLISNDTPRIRLNW